MICLSLLLPLAFSQQSAPASQDRAREAWDGLQQRFSSAAAVSFCAPGEFLATAGAGAGRTLATLDVTVTVATPGFGEIHVTARAAGADGNTAVDASAFGTEEGIWSVTHGSERAFGCGGAWNASTELDDFAFLGAAWSGWCARRGPADVVAYVPAHAEHPGLTGLRVRWDGDGEEGHRSAIWWLDGEGELRSADVRIDANTVLHWRFSGFTTQTECDPAQFVAVLPEGFVRDGFHAAPASADSQAGLTGGETATAPPCEPSPIERMVEAAIEQGTSGQEPATTETPAATDAPGNDG